ncbi:MAG: pyrroline-5-carboxylate reductase [Spirochaetaceae bacterium]|jgi:pyrroline-5-carboxylate reductase|nr:pyrroline-5-carboxylate reductase [Spirochaetaceae bacterium]
MMGPLETYSFGFIGAGVMGSALLAAAVKTIPASKITVTDISHEKYESAAAQFGCKTGASNREVVQKTDIIFLAVKPDQIPSTIAHIAPELSGKILVSIAAGVSLSALAKYTAGCDVAAIIRIMPNLPATIGEGMLALSALESSCSRHAAALVKEALKAAGVIEEVDERLMDCVTGISGSGPAYACLFIEALADAAVLLGMPRQQAYLHAAQTLKGAAALVLESHKHPAALKDAVCSPAGTTIEAVRVLEAKGFRSAVIEAAIAAAKKAAQRG